MPYAPCWKKLFDIEVEQLNAQVRPISKLSLVNAPMTANVNIITGTSTTQNPLIVTRGPCIFRIYVALSVSAVFSVQRQTSGAFVTENMNQGSALAANAGYMFDVLVDVGEKIDFQSTVTGTVLKLSVVEKDDAK